MIPDADYMPAGAEMDAMIAQVFHLPNQRFSTEISAALRLLDHVAGRKFFSWSMCNTDGTGSDPLCVVEIIAGSATRLGCGESHISDLRMRDGIRESYELDEIMPLAICRAILDAVRMNREKLNVKGGHQMTINVPSRAVPLP